MHDTLSFPTDFQIIRKPCQASFPLHCRVELCWEGEVTEASFSCGVEQHGGHVAGPAPTTPLVSITSSSATKQAQGDQFEVVLGNSLRKLLMPFKGLQSIHSWKHACKIVQALLLSWPQNLAATGDGCEGRRLQLTWRGSVTGCLCVNAL